MGAWGHRKELYVLQTTFQNGSTVTEKRTSEKSLIFQCLPIADDALFERPGNSSVVFVISQLRSIMDYH